MNATLKENSFNAIKQVRWNESISFRLSLSLGALIFLAMMISFSFLSYFSFEREIQSKRDALQATATIFAAPIADELVLDNRHGVQRVLTGIGRFKQFKFASVFLPNGAPYAEVGFDVVLLRNDVDLQTRSAFEMLFHDDLWVEDEIRKSGAVIGHIKLLSDVAGIRASLFRNLVATLVLAILFALATIVLCMYSIRIITKPIGVLSAFMVRAGQEQNYSSRTVNHGRGEMGVLSKSFNIMLEGIETRNHALLDYQQTLENKVEDRTYKLKLAKNEAELANAAKSEFLATMSHEIRTPMNGMLVMAELLATSGLTPKHQRYADIVIKSGKSLLTIINDVLDFSKIESGNLELEIIPVTIRNLVEDAMSLFWQAAIDKGLDISCYIDPRLPAQISGDPVRLNQIICNLINNALKFTEKGHIRISLDAVDQNDGSSAIKFSVIDTGVGIHRDKLTKIFESFTQADQSTTRRFGGTGLGLPICKRLVEAMRGEINVTSEPGHGTAFFFIIPTDASWKKLEGFPKRAETALLVLPISATFHVLKEGLERFGITVRSISDISSLGQSNDGFTYVFARTKDISYINDTITSKYNIAITSLGEFEMEALVSKGIVHDTVALPLSSYGIVDVAERLLADQPLGHKLLEKETNTSDDVKLFGGSKILVADDNPVNREVIVQALHRFGVEPTVVDNGLEALAVFNAQTFDLILMDCSMPEMDGFQATDVIRQREAQSQAKRTPIIALTAHVADQISEQWQKSGMDGIIVKPFTMEALSGCLEQWLELSSHSAKTNDSVSLDLPEPLTDNTCDLYDPKALENLKDILGDAFDTSFIRLLKLYAEHAPGLIVDLAGAIEAEDTVATSDFAHALKSMTGNISASNLSAQCDLIEKAANERNFIQAGEIFDKARMLHDAIMADITSKTTVDREPEIDALDVAG